MSLPNPEEETLPVSEASDESVSVADSTDTAVPVAKPDRRLRKIFHEKRKNGRTLGEALAVISRNADVPATEFVGWEKPQDDTVIVRERKERVAADLGERFPKTDGALARAAGVIGAWKWSEAWQAAAEKALARFSDAAGTFCEATAELTIATGLIPPGGSVRAFRELFRVLGALLAVRGEKHAADFVLNEGAAAKLETLRAAVQVVENSVRHKALLSLPYPDEASENSQLETWLRLWTEAEFSWAFPRWQKRRKVVSALRKLASCSTQSPLDPRVDLGNLIALRVCKKEFSDKHAATVAAYPCFFDGLNACGALARVEALEKARKSVETILAKLENFPEKRDAWQTVFARWLSGNAAEFAEGGAVETAYKAALVAYAAFDEACVALGEAVGTETLARNWDTAECAKAFADEMFADRERWRDICAWNAAELAAGRRGMEIFAADVRSGKIPAECATVVFETEYCRRWAKAVWETTPALADYASGEARERLAAFCETNGISAVLLPEFFGEKENVPAENAVPVEGDLPCGNAEISENSEAI